MFTFLDWDTGRCFGLYPDEDRAFRALGMNAQDNFGHWFHYVGQMLICVKIEISDAICAAQDWADQQNSRLAQDGKVIRWRRAPSAHPYYQWSDLPVWVLL